MLRKLGLMFMLALASLAPVALTGCDVDVNERGPIEGAVEGDGLEVEVD